MRTPNNSKDDLNDLDLEFQLRKHRVEPPTLDGDFKQTLRSKLGEQYDRYHVVSIGARLSSWPLNFRATRSLRIAGLALAISMVVTLGLVIRPKSVSAAEILNRAIQVTQNAAASGLQSYQGVIDETHPENGFTDLSTHWQVHVWEKAPNRFRIERFGESPYVYPPNHIPNERIGIISAPTQPLHVDKASLSDLAVSDGVSTWQLELGPLLTAVSYNADDFEAPIADEFLGIFSDTSIKNPTNIQNIVQRLAPEYAAATRGQDSVIAGRPVYTVQLIQKPDDLFLTPWTITVWIDQVTYFPLGSEERTGTGVLLGHAAFTTFQINLPIDPNVFRYTPPAEAHVIDWHPIFPASTAELYQAWHQVMAQWGNRPLYIPAYVPQPYVSDSPQLSNEEFPIFLSPPPYVIQRFYVNGIHVITLRQNIGVFENWATDAYTVHIGPFTGEFYNFPDVPKTLQLHIVDKNDVRINFLITADSSVSNEELLKMVGSLQEMRFDGTPYF